MTNINQHFKERNPSKTIKIIQKFFEKKGFIIKEEQFKKSEIGTYSNIYNLIYNNKIILSSNGKGMTPKYCQASGLGELYERYCNYASNASNNYFMNLYYSQNNLPQLSYEKIISQNFIKNYFLLLTNNNLEKMKKLILKRFDNKFYGFEYINLIDNTIQLFDNRLIECINTSVGLAAGNTLDEAINQGLSEYFEKFLQEKFYSCQQEYYYCIDLKSIKNKKINKLINNIQNLGYKFYIVDLSYNFQMPVLMSILINNQEQNIIINFGAFPVIDIALERIITELYQGIFSFKKFSNKIMIPIRNIELEEILRTNYQSYAYMRTFPENFFNKIIYTQYNKEIFLEGNYSNNYLKKHLINICKKLNLNPYYFNLSQDKNMVAIRILIPSLNLKTDLINQYYKYDIDNIYNYTINKYTFIKMLQDNVDNKILIDYYKNKCLLLLNKENEINNYYYSYNLSPIDPYQPFGLTVNLLENFFFFFYNNITITYYYCGIHFFTKYIKKYLTLKNFLMYNKYSKQEIKNFFNILGEEITEKDFLNINNFDYLFEQIYLIPMKKYIQSNEYKELVLKICNL